MQLSRSLGGALVLALVSHVAGAAPVDHDKAPPAATTPGIRVAQATSPAPAPAGAITGAAAMNALIGNTLVLSSESSKPEEQLALYFLADGTVKGAEGNRPKTGKWTLTGNKLCVMDSNKEEPRPRDCVDLAVAGDDVTLTVTLSGGKTDAIRGKILKGNPRNL